MAEIPTSFLQGLQSGQSALDAADRVKLASGELALQREQLKTQREIATRQMDFEREKMGFEGELQREAEASRLEGFRRLNESNERIAREGRESQERISKAELAQREQQQKQANDLAREQMNLMKQQNEEERKVRWFEADAMVQSNRMAVKRQMAQLELAQKENSLTRQAETAEAATVLTEMKARTQLRRGLEPTIKMTQEAKNIGAATAPVTLETLPNLIAAKTEVARGSAAVPVLGFLNRFASSVYGTFSTDIGAFDEFDEMAAIAFEPEEGGAGWGKTLRDSSAEERRSLIGSQMTKVLAQDLGTALADTYKKSPGEVETLLRSVMIAAGSNRGEEAVLAELKKFEKIGVPAEAVIAALDSYTATALTRAAGVRREAEINPSLYDESRAITGVHLNTLDYMNQIHVNLRAAANGRYQTPTSIEALKAFTGREFLTGAARAQREGNLGEFLEGYLEADGLMHLADDLESLINQLSPELNSMLKAKEIVDGLRREVIDRDFGAEREALSEELDIIGQQEERLRGIFGR